MKPKFDKKENKPPKKWKCPNKKEKRKFQEAIELEKKKLNNDITIIKKNRELVLKKNRISTKPITHREKEIVLV